MRILLTNLGCETIRVFSEEHKVIKDSREYLNHSKSNKTLKSPNLRKVSLQSQKTENNEKTDGNPRESTLSIIKLAKNDPNSTMNRITRDETNMSADLSPSSRSIYIKQKKIMIPKNISDRYNDRLEAELNSNKNSIILPELPDKLYSKEDSPEKNKNHNEIFSLRKIFGENKLKQLKQKMKTDKDIRDAHFVMDNSQMRTPYVEKTPEILLNEHLKKGVDSNQINIIRYLHNKDQISEKLIQRLSEFDSKRIRKLNKLCQIVEHNEEDLERINISVKQKVKGMKMNEKLETKSKVEEVHNEVNICNTILGGYPGPNAEKTIPSCLRDKFHELNEHWDRIKVSRFYQSRRSNSMCNMSSMTKDTFMNSTFNNH